MKTSKVLLTYSKKEIYFLLSKDTTDLGDCFTIAEWDKSKVEKAILFF